MDYNALDELTDNTDKSSEQNTNSSRMPGNQNKVKKRAAFLAFLITGLLFTTLALGVAIYWNATKISLLEQGIINYADLSDLEVSPATLQESVKLFAMSTLAYLQGTTDEWKLTVETGGFSIAIPVPGSFLAHMASVRSWFTSAPTYLLAIFGITILLLGWALINIKGNANGIFPKVGYYLGALIPLPFIIAIGTWGYLDFDSLWTQLHLYLIPDGFFSAAEPIMQWFPLELFQGYLKPVAATFIVLEAVVFALPILIIPLLKGTKTQNHSNNKRC